MLPAVLLIGQSVYAQSDSVRTKLTYTVRHEFADYDEEILYYGKHDQYFTVRIYRKNGVLFRTDSYTLLPKTLSNGFQLDSVSRIIHHGPTRIMYPSGEPYINCDYKDNVLHGPFMAFYEDGTIKRKEFYKNGRLTKSQCFTLDGTEQRCEPFYQAAKFLGKTQDLQAYLKQKMESILDGERVRRVNAALTINEIGQVVRVSVSVYTAPYAEQQVPVVGSYVQQILRNMPEWTPDKFNWKPAINDGKAISSTCVMTIFRTYGGIQFYLSYRM
ncbi:hypothetical protein GO730_05145 [Spirosoma sp. HMF3257]|uniref:Uncharacterized protein n=1 Tax=Spirosoma telluris TaxID=2183553 RepID=A0A327NHX7_9BACT|nr:hypothetical protein [Spirosoma telluris]RAI73909.1 hypothetical protein HMF3257_05115 [Spirosoma telluris]